MLAAVLSFSAGSPVHASKLVSRPAHEPPSQIIWLSVPGPGGGGGGGGKEEQSPARAARVKGTDAQTMPAAPPAASDASEKPLSPVSLPDAPIPDAWRVRVDRVGIDRSRGGFTVVRKRLLPHGVGTGRGTGAGPGSGSGLGPGDGGNIGDGVYGPGGDVTMPVAVHQEKPRHTIEAIRARIQGAVVIECVVQPTGVCERFRASRDRSTRGSASTSKRSAPSRRGVSRLEPGAASLSPYS